MGSERRLFLAVALDDDTRHALAAFVSAPGRPNIPGRRVTPPNWHITLRFLGRSTALRRDLVLRSLHDQLDMDGFTIGFDGLGAFPYPMKGRVLWLGVGAGGEHLEELAVTCERAAVAAGYDPEERPFHPHLSLARVRPPQDLTKLIDEFPRFPGRLRVDGVVMYESITGGATVRYEELDRIPLAG